ncbi:MAG: hypothetical protein OEU51_03600 [Gammaproteobacteria bacterium]|nr:hypothetical protein [Gammaproteobacteria bacterium]
MITTFNICNRPHIMILGTVLITAFFATVFSVFANVSERVWHLTRSLEVWQLDELLLAVSLSAIVGLVAAFTQISSLTKQIAELRTSISGTKKNHAVNVEQSEYIVQCAICNKYENADNRWLSDADYITQRYNENVIAGVCPNCRDDYGEYRAD